MSKTIASIYGKTPEQWILVEVGDLIASGQAELQTGPFGTMLHASAYKSVGTPVVAVQHIGENRLRHVDLPRVDDETRERLARYRLRVGDILFGRKGAVDRRALVQPEEEGWLQGSDCIRLRFLNGEIDPVFVSYVLGSRAYRDWIVRNAQGATMPSLNQEIIGRVPLPLPPFHEQRAITHILGTMDDKIELNRQMNETLEAMARAIFKSWFVDFDPVHAKAEGHNSLPAPHSAAARQAGGLPPHLTALFPDSFEDSELGGIPKGWRVRKLSDVTLQITKGTTPTQEDISSAPVTDTHVNYLRVNAISEAGSFLYDKLTTIPESVHKGALKRSILQANDVVYTIAGTIGRIAVIGDDLLPANTNQAVAIIRPKSEVSPAFLVFAMRQQAFQEELHSKIVHAVQANLSLGMISEAKINFPPEALFARIFNPIEEIVRKITASRAQSRTLAALRDALPNASFIGFTGTPIEKTDANTRAVFGDYISVYDIQRAVTDGATVPIYYESRLAKLELKASERPKIDPEFEEATEGEEVERKEKLKSKWAQLEAVVGSENRIKLIARDLVEHFENRLVILDGKAMVVCMSRRICVDLYREIVALRPDWYRDKDEQGAIKVVMTGSASDPIDWQPHIRNKPRREALALRFRLPAAAAAQAGDEKDSFKLVIVRDMWLTGFDAPSLHTMYVDKPMRGHGLMQAIARVNRVFMDKPGGLVVDYLGLADELKKALATYTESGGTGKTAIDQAEAVALMLAKYEICRDLFHLPAPPPGQHCVYALLCENQSIYIGHTDDLMRRWREHQAGTASDWTRRYKPLRIAHYETVPSREEAVKVEKEWKTGFGRKRLKRLIETGGARQAGGFDWSHWITGTPQQRLSLLPAAQEHILAQEDGKARLLRAVTELSQAFALAVPHEETVRVRDDVAFFQAVRAVLAKNIPGERKSDEELDYAIRQIISKAMVSDEVVDIFAAAGLKKPDISILSDEFLAEVHGMPQRNLAVELLRKLLSGEIKMRSRRNIVQGRSFAELLEQAVRKYQHRAIEAAQVIEELIALAQEMRAADQRGEQLGLSSEEIAFYDALEVNDSAVKVLGEPTLMTIARELVDTVRKNVSIDWAVRETVRAKLRVLVKRILRKYGYPPDKQEKATQTVLEQAELLCTEWVAA